MACFHTKGWRGSRLLLRRPHLHRVKHGLKDAKGTGGAIRAMAMLMTPKAKTLIDVADHRLEQSQSQAQLDPSEPNH